MPEIDQTISVSATTGAPQGASVLAITTRLETRTKESDTIAKRIVANYKDSENKGLNIPRNGPDQHARVRPALGRAIMSGPERW